MTLLAAIARHADEAPDAIALRAGDSRLAYRELMRAIEARVATWRGGDAVAVVRASEPIATLIDALAARAAHKIPLIVEDGGALDVRERFAGTAWLKRTGGSTGTPKLCAFSEAQALATASHHAALAGLRRGAVYVTTVAPWTSLGWNAWSGALVAGATLRFVPPTVPRDWLAALAEPDVVHGVTTPPFVRAAARLPRRDEARRAPVSCSAAAYPLEEARELEQRHGVAVLDRLGATETGTIALARVPGGPLHAAPDVTLTFEARDGRRTLTVQSPMVALGFLGGAAFEGVYRTNDEVEGDVDAFVVRGRVDRIVKRAGRVVELAAVEALVVRYDGVARARLVALPHGLDVELVLQVVAEPELATDALVAWLAERLAPHERPSRVERVAPTGDLAKWTSAHV